MEDPRVIVADSDALEIACSTNNLTLVKHLIEDGYVVGERIGENALVSSLISPGTEVMVYLLSHSEPSSPRGLLHHAVAANNIQAVRLLLTDPRIAPKTEDSSALVAAILRCKYDILRLLLRDGRFDPSANQEEALELAVSVGDLVTVQILLADRRVNASANDNIAIKLADYYGNDKIVARLRDYGARM